MLRSTTVSGLVMSKRCDSESSLPRLCGHHRHRPNVPAQTSSDYFPHTISPILDHLYSRNGNQIWCTDHQQTALQGLYLVPSWQEAGGSFTKFQQLDNFYKDDLSTNCSLVTFTVGIIWSGNTERKNMDQLSFSLGFYHTLYTSDIINVPHCQHYTFTLDTLHSSRHYL